MPAEDPGAEPLHGVDSTPPPSSRASLPPITWRTNLLLFLATVYSTFLTGAISADPAAFDGGLRGVLFSPAVLAKGASFAVPLMAILLTHELGHFIAARIHRVDASLPYFIPLPVVSPFGTMGAVISMRGRIRSRDALLDIGASGPLAGLCVAIPVLVIGLVRSRAHDFVPLGTGVQEGQCLLYLLLKYLVLGPIPAGKDVLLDPMAFAGWAGLFVTMLNLVAVAQLDGGHIAYALFGPKQNAYARRLHAGLLLIFAYNLARFVGPVVMARKWDALGQAISNSTFWLVWYVLIHVIMRVGGREHPPTEPGELSPVRRGLAVLSLVLFVLLFMPTPYAQY